MTPVQTPNSRPIEILIADDHEMVREGLRTLLSDEPDLRIVGEASNGRDAVALAGALHPHVVLMDLVMPEMDGIEAAHGVRAASPDSHVLILTSFADDLQVREALQAGASGYLLKDVLKAELLRAIHDAAQGRPTLHPDIQRRLMQQITDPAASSPLDSLTPRERDVLALIGQGCSNKQIAASLRLTQGTVKGYVSAVFAKLGVADRTQAALTAVKHGLVSGDLESTTVPD